MPRSSFYFRCIFLNPQPHPSVRQSSQNEKVSCPWCGDSFTVHRRDHGILTIPSVPECKDALSNDARSNDALSNDALSNDAISNDAGNIPLQPADEVDPASSSIPECHLDPSSIAAWFICHVFDAHAKLTLEELQAQGIESNVLISGQEGDIIVNFVESKWLPE